MESFVGNGHNSVVLLNVAASTFFTSIIFDFIVLSAKSEWQLELRIMQIVTTAIFCSKVLVII